MKKLFSLSLVALLTLFAFTAFAQNKITGAKENAILGSKQQEFIQKYEKEIQNLKLYKLSKKIIIESSDSFFLNIKIYPVTFDFIRENSDMETCKNMVKIAVDTLKNMGINPQREKRFNVMVGVYLLEKEGEDTYMGQAMYSSSRNDIKWLKAR